MYTGTLPATSNRATWSEAVEVTDDETGDLIDLSEVEEIEIAVRDLESQETMMTGTLTGGEVDIISTGIFTWTFTADQMGGMDVKRTYEVGVTITDDTETIQLVIGFLPLLDGIVT